MKINQKYSLVTFIQFIIKASVYVQVIFLVIYTLDNVSQSFGWRNAGKIVESIEVRVTKAQPIPVSSLINGKLSDGAFLSLDSGTLSFPSSKEHGFMLFKLIFIWVGFAFTIGITILLKRIFKTMALDSPFNKQNASRIKIIAFLLVASSLATFIHDWLLNGYLKENFMLEGSQIRSHLTIDLKTVFAGFIILIISEIFREGTRLKEEQDLTV